MAGFEKPNIIENLVPLEKCLIVDDDFKELFLQREIFSQRMLNDIRENVSPPLDYCMKLLRHCPDAFTQFIDILIKTKQNDIVDLLLSAT